MKLVVAGLLLACAWLGGARAVPAPVPQFQHVLVLVMENKDKGEVLGSGDAPYFNSLASRYAVLSNYRGVAHPSLPNYLALVSGSTHGIQSDCTSCTVSGRNLADTLERSHRSWKTYAEGLPRAGWTGPSSGRYAKKHDPFLYFRDVLASPARRRRVVPLRQFSRDLAANRLPSFSLVVPDLCHDMHDCSVATGDSWLKGFLKPLLASPKLANSVVFVVFDEPNSAAPSGKVPALALGPLVLTGSVDATRTSHYGLLRTIEDAWGLPRLGHSAGALPITGIWR
ncbi:MAG: alkaline phosphatase family protein [Gaiellaceae bacterium]